MLGHRTTSCIVSQPSGCQVNAPTANGRSCLGPKVCQDSASLAQVGGGDSPGRAGGPATRRRASSIARHLFALLLASNLPEGTLSSTQNGTWRKQFPPWNETDAPTAGAPVIFFPLLGPFTSHGCFPSRYMAMRIAVSHVNRRDSTVCPAIADITSHFELQYEAVDTGGKPVGAVSALVKKFAADFMDRIKTVLGPNSSGESAAASNLLSVYNIPQVGFAATSATLSNKANYPNFFRMTAPDSIVMAVLAGLIASVGWQEFSVIYFDAVFQSGQAADLEQCAQTKHGLVVHSFSVPNSGEGGAPISDENRRELEVVLQVVRSLGVRVVAGLALAEEAWGLWSAANAAGMVHANNWVWLGGDGINGNQFAGDVSRVEAFSGTLFITASVHGPSFETFVKLWDEEMETTEVPEFEEMDLCRDSDQTLDASVCSQHQAFTGWNKGSHDAELLCQTYTPMAYDAVVSIAVVADRLMRGSGGQPRHPDDITAEEWMDEMKKLSEPGNEFTCLSGPISLDANQDRPLPMAFWNWQAGSLTATQVASWNSITGYMWIPGTTIVWPSGAAAVIQEEASPPLVPSGVSVQTCPLGKTLGGDGECEECPPGFFKDWEGKSPCLPCASGWFASQSGQPTCDRCELGSYQPLTGQVSCNSCSDLYEGAVTRYLGATSNESCICPERMYWAVDEEAGAGPAANCELCTEGLECAAGRDEPMQAQGYHVDIIDSADRTYSVYRCSDPAWCPEGPLGACAGGLKGAVCSLCDAGKAWDADAGGCEPCDHGTAWLKTMSCLAVLCVLVACLHRSSIATDDHDSFTALTEVVLTVGSLITLLQIGAVIGQLELNVGSPLQELFAFSRLMAFDVGSLNLQCSVGMDWEHLYVSICLLPVGMVGCYAFVMLLLYTLWGHKTALLRFVNTIGTLFSACYIALLMHGSRAFITFEHPNGRSSIVAAPEILTDEPTYQAIVVVAIAQLVFYGAGYLSVCMVIVWKLSAAQSTPLAPLNIMRWSRFFYYKFRPERYYWTLVQVLRSLFLNFVPILVHAKLTQMMLIQAILLFYLLAQNLAWPYRHFSHNFLDSLAHIAVLLITSAAAFSLPRSGGNLETGILVLAVAPIALFACVFAGVLLQFLHLGTSRCRMTSEEREAERMKRMARLRAGEQTYIATLLGCDDDRSHQGILMAEELKVPKLEQVVAWRPQLDPSELIQTPSADNEVTESPSNGYNLSGGRTLSKEVLTASYTGEASRGLEKQNTTTTGLTKSGAAFAAIEANVTLVLPKEHPCMKLPTQALAVLESKIRYRALSWRSKIHQKPNQSLVDAMLENVAPLPSWTEGEIHYLQRLSQHIIEYLQLYVTTLSEDRYAMMLLADYVLNITGEFCGVFGACVRDVLQKDTAFQLALDEGHRLKTEAEAEPSCSIKWPKNHVELVALASAQQELLNAYGHELASGLGRASPGVMKSLFRILEKQVFEGKDDNEVKSWDSSRLLIIFRSMASLAEACRRVLHDHRNGKIRLVRVKERFSEPTSGGWSDVLLNFQFVGKKGKSSEMLQLPNEIQLVHYNLMVIRKDLGAHNTYAKVRGAADIIDLCNSKTARSRQSPASKDLRDAVVECPRSVVPEIRTIKQGFQDAESSAVLAL